MICGLQAFAQEESVYIVQDQKKKEEKKLEAFDSGEYTRMDPLAPAKAAFYSAVLPGLGQAFNKRYWKIPLVYAAIGSSAYGFINADNAYRKFRDAFKSRRMGFMTDPYYDLNGNGIFPGFPDVSDSSLQKAQEQAQQDRDFALVMTIGMYALNIIDANVDAHLKQFNVNADLSINYRPALLIEPIVNKPYFGMDFTFNF